MLECKYPVIPFNKYNVAIWVQNKDVPVTVKQVMDQFNLSHTQAIVMLDGLVKTGLLQKRNKTFWNGMFYCTRNYYW